MSMNTVPERLAALRAAMKANGVDVYLIPVGDPHSSEYLPDHYTSLTYFSGFHGENSNFVVTMTESAVWADGRYFVQAEKEIAGTEIQLMRMGEPGVPTAEEYCGKVLPEGGTLGLCGLTANCALVNNLKKELEPKHGSIKTEKTVEGAAIEKFKTSSNYGDYQLNLNFDKVADSDQISGNTKVLAAVITTTDGTQYGLRHVENIWKGTEFAWGTGFTTQSHGCPISGEHYASMMGKKIDAVTYYTENGVVKYDIDDTYVPYKFDTSAFKVENADVTSGSAKVTVPTLPEAYDAEYAAEGLTNVSVENGTLKYNATGVKPGQYTLNVTDKSSKYAPFSTSFTLTTDNVVAAYNNDVKAPALVAAKDVQADDFANFVKNIQKVSVNGKAGYPRVSNGRLPD